MPFIEASPSIALPPMTWLPIAKHEDDDEQ
jgi:hypothetical protein